MSYQVLFIKVLMILNTSCVDLTFKPAHHFLYIGHQNTLTIQLWKPDNCYPMNTTRSIYAQSVGLVVWRGEGAHSFISADLCQYEDLRVDNYGVNHTAEVKF